MSVPLEVLLADPTYVHLSIVSLHFGAETKSENLIWYFKKTFPPLITLPRGHFTDYIEFLAELKQGTVTGVKVRLDRLQALISTSSIEHLEFGGEDVNLDKALLHRLA